MKSGKYALSVFFAISMFCSLVAAQQGATTSSSATVPRLVNVSGKTTDGQGKAISGIVGVTFAIYRDQHEGVPLWLETQNVQADAKGNYTAQLGATKAEGLPLDLFSSGEARWLGVTVNGGQDQPRVLLLSVPYALKAADAETIGGLPPSAFMLAGPASSTSSRAANPAASTSASSTFPPNPGVTGAGTANFIPLWDASSDIVNSVLFQSGSGTTAKVGINTSTPSTTLDVKGAETVRGNLSLPATGTATTTAGKNSQPTTFAASAFNSGTGAAVNQNFRWQAEPLGNNTASTSGTLNLLYGAGSNPLAETGLRVGSTGHITFATGQTFPGTGPGTVKSVGLSAPSSDFTVSGSPVTSTGTLALNWAIAPTSANTPNTIVKRDNSGSFFAHTISADVQINSNQIAIADQSTDGPALTATTNCIVSGCAAIVATSAYGNGVIGRSGSTSSGAAGVYGYSYTILPINTFGVLGWSNGTTGLGVAGHHGSAFGSLASSIMGTAPVGVLGDSNGYGIVATSDSGNALLAQNNSTADTLVSINNGGGFPLYVQGTGGSVYVDASGDLVATGSINGSSKNFVIDHPLDPANKYLYHASVESSEMKNIYDGNITTDKQGNAVVELPDWFEALNRDFRYQLTVIGQFAQAIVASEIANRQFSIKTDKPNVKVSWQVTGIRQDAWAHAHPIPVEQLKPEGERGLYLHPELFGAPAEKAIGVLHHPLVQKMLKEQSALRATSNKQ